MKFKITKKKYSRWILELLNTIDPGFRVRYKMEEGTVSGSEDTIIVEMIKELPRKKVYESPLHEKKFSDYRAHVSNDKKYETYVVLHLQRRSKAEDRKS